jgi:hypothetical protein
MIVPDSIPTGLDTDVTGAIQAWLDQLGNGTAGSPVIAEFEIGATYRIDGTLRLKNRRHLTVRGRGATFRAVTEGTRNRACWDIIDSDHVALQYVKVCGAALGPEGQHLGGALGEYRAALEAQHGVNIQSSTNVTLTAMRIRDVWGDFVYVGMGGTRKDVNGWPLWSSDVKLDRLSCGYSGRQGLTVVAGSNVLMTGSSMSQVRRSTIDLEPNSSRGGARNVSILGNRFGAHRFNWLASVGAEGATISDILAVGNVVRGGAINVDVRDRGGVRERYTFTDNTSEGMLFGAPTGAAMRFAGVDGVAVLRNVQPFQTGRGMVMAKFTNCTDVAYDG